MYSHVAAVMLHISCVLLNIGLYFIVFFLYLGSICSMHVYFVRLIQLLLPNQINHYYNYTKTS